MTSRGTLHGVLCLRGGVACAALILTCLFVAPVAGADARIAFSRDSHIWTVRPDGSGLRQVTTGKAQDIAPSWSRSRGTIAFLRFTGNPPDVTKRVWLVRSDGSGLRRLSYAGSSLASGSSALAYSPNGRFLAGGCQLGEGSLYGVTVLDLRTRLSRVVARIACEGGVISLSWSPGGTQLAVCVEYGGGAALYRIDPQHGGRIPTHLGYMASSVSWRPDGDRLLCSVWRADLPGYPTWTMLFKPDGTKVRTLAKAQADPVYSPDGRRYAFAAVTHDGPTGLYVANADGTHVRKVCAAESIWRIAWR
jgi:Tol biopolymer transport system component